MGTDKGRTGFGFRLSCGDGRKAEAVAGRTPRGGIRKGRVLRSGLAVSLALLLSACQEDLYTGLTQRSANDMMAVLAENDIKVTRATGDTAGTFKIRVASDDMARAVRVLRSAGYPKDSYRSIAEMFPGDGIIVTPYEQRARMSYAVSQELSRTISDIDGVVSARVHVMLPEGDTRNSGRNLPPSASVVVQHREAVDAADLAQRVRLIVANAVTNLPARNVAVSLFPAKASAEPSALAAGISQPGAGLFEVRSPFGFTLWILAALALLAGVLVFNSVRKQQGS
jgi:type III secretion protein J